MSQKTLNLIKESDAKWVDLRFTDPRGKEQHVTNHKDSVDEDFFEIGAMFDGSSIAGWKSINESDMILMPDDSSAVIDPLQKKRRLICDVTSWSLPHCRVTSAIHVRLRNAQRPTSNLPVLAIQPTLDPSQSFSFLMRSSSKII